MESSPGDKSTIRKISFNIQIFELKYQIRKKRRKLLYGF